MKRLVDQFALLHQMSSINRYSRDHMVKRENVLEHTGFVALFCLLIAKALKREHFPMDVGRLLEKAIVHDIDEPVLGDIPRPTKYMSEAVSEGFKKAERLAVQNLSKFYNVSLKRSWVGAKDDTPEGRLVALADFAAVVYAVWSEVALYGNFAFTRVGHELMEAFEKYQTKFEWEQTLLIEMKEMTRNVLKEDRRHPDLNPSLKLERMLSQPQGGDTLPVLPDVVKPEPEIVAEDEGMIGWEGTE